MKITKIATGSFPVSENAEKSIEWRMQCDLRARIMGAETRIMKGYLPLAKYGLERDEGKKIKKNNVYVDLSNGEIFFFRGKQVVRYDLPQRILDLTPAAVRTFGLLHREGDRLLEELEDAAVEELRDRRLIRVYRQKTKMLAALLLDELSADASGKKTETKEHVGLAYPLPVFVDRGYDLGCHLPEHEEIVEEYAREAIKYSTDTVGAMLKNVFGAKVSLDGLTYMPYLRCQYHGRDKYSALGSGVHYPLCFGKGTRKRGVKIKPLALCTEIGKKGTVPVETSTIDYSDVVGMKEVKKRIYDAIIRPLKEPEKARKLGKKAGGAILLYGPPGCGKSYIAKATIGEAALPFINVNVCDIASEGGEEAAKRMHEVFEEAAKNSPSIIFFDELDAVGRRRGKSSGGERMMITQMLTELDGAQSTRENVLVIAATNAPWDLDPALRRAGRFTAQVYVSPPDKEAREGIFRKNLAAAKTADVDCGKLAEATEGYSSADITAVCELAAQRRWDYGGEALSMEDLLCAVGEQKTTLTAWMRTAEKEIRESNEADLYKELAEQVLKCAGGIEAAERPKIRFSDVGGMEKVKKEIRNKVIYPMKYPLMAEKFGRSTGGILLYGPPGCGKTYIAKAAAGECEAAYYNVNLTDIISANAGDSEKRIHEIFTRARKNAPAILFFDELDAVGGRRDAAGGGMERRIVNQLLVELDGFTENKGLTVIAATNMPWDLDAALTRSGRFNRKILVPPPDLGAREEIFRLHLKDKPVAEEVDVRTLAERTGGCSASDIAAICERAAESAWEETAAEGVGREITEDDLLAAAGEQESSVAPWTQTAREKTEYSEDYREMHELLDEEKTMEAEVVDPEPDGEDMVSDEKKRLEEKMALAELRYLEGVISREDFRLIMMHYQQKMVDLGIQLKGDDATEEMMEPDAMCASQKLEDDGLMMVKDMEWSVGRHPSGRLHYRIRSMRGDVYRVPG